MRTPSDSNNLFLNDIISLVAKRAGMKKIIVEKVLRYAFDEMGNKLAEGCKIYLTDFLNLKTRDYKDKKYRHPVTKETLRVEPYRTITATPTKALKQKCKEAFNK